jgi:hypothetical protein
MALTFAVNRFASSNVQAVHRRERKRPTAATAAAATATSDIGRRGLLLLTTATLVLSSLIVMAGVFGMNFRIELFKIDKIPGTKKLLWTVGGGTAGMIFLYVFAIACYKRRRLLE